MLLRVRTMSRFELSVLVVSLYPKPSGVAAQKIEPSIVSFLLSKSILCGSMAMSSLIRIPFSNEKNTNIVNIKEKLKSINADLRECGDSFSIEDIEKRRVLESEKEFYEKTLKQAETHKQKQLEKSTPEVVKEARHMIANYKTLMNQRTKKDSEKVLERVKEIQQIYDEIKERDDFVYGEISNFIKRFEPYLDNSDKEEFANYGDLSTHVDLLYRELDNGGDYYNNLSVTKSSFQQNQLKISGLFPPAQRIK